MPKPSVAVFGLNGALGESTLAAFSSPAFSDKFQLPVLAITRDATTKTSTNAVKYVQGDIQNGKDSLVQKLANTDVVISLLGATPDVLAHIEKIVEELRPKVYIPSQFGINIPAANMIFPGFLGFKTAHSEKVRSFGIKVVDIYTSFFVGGVWLYDVIGHIGADAESDSVTYLGSPDTKLSYTTLEDIGRVIVSVSLKASEEKNFPDALRVQSGIVSPAEVVQRYEETNNTTLNVKEIVPKEKALLDAKKVWAQGFDGSKFMYYLNVLVSQGEGGGVHFTQNDDELVNPGESLWKWQKF